MVVTIVRIYKVVSRFGLVASLVVGAGMPIVLTSSAAAADGAKCYDALAGVATSCPKSTGFPVDGKKPAPTEDPFQAGKCYTIADTEKGWVTSDCSGDNFKKVVPTQSVPNNIDQATTGNCPTELDPQKQCDIVRQYLNPIINGLAILVVIAVVISIVIAGIQYSASADQPGATAAARQRIINAVVALVAFTFLWAFLQWLVPGGIF